MKSSDKNAQPLPVIGWQEWVRLPRLGVDAIKAKIDTGAATSAIHAWHIEPFEKNGEEWVSFELHPLQKNNRFVVPGQAKIKDMRPIKNSGGMVQNRYIIQTFMHIGLMKWRIELSLTKRDDMGFRMLLGRQALRGRLLVDPENAFLLSSSDHP